MSKKIVLILASFLIANSSFATKARLLALGMTDANSEGSFYIEDNRNIFINVANVNNYANNIFMEFGGTSLASGGLDSDLTPKAMGGFLHQHGNYVMGAYLGNEANTSIMSKVLSGGLPQNDNFLDLFIGSEAMGLKWGANVSYADYSNKVTPELSTSYYSLRLGALAEKWESYLMFGLGSKAKGVVSGTAAEYKGKLAAHVGGSYNVAGGKVFANYKKSDWELNISSVTVKSAASSMAIGYGRSHKLDHGTLFSSISYMAKELEIKSSSNPTKLKNTMVPVTFGYEGTATSWLTLRGSITQNLMGTKNNEHGIHDYTAPADAANPTDAEKLANFPYGMLTTAFKGDTLGKDATITSSTTVAAGATLNFGKLSVDGTFTGTTTGKLNMTTFLSRVGMTYTF